MANCCEIDICKKLLTVGDINSMIASATLDCTNYDSGGSVSHNGCCDGSYDEYSPNFDELTKENKAEIWFQNWSKGDKEYKDKDGLVITDPLWVENDCCSGITNVTLNNSAFRYEVFKDFTISSATISVGNCYTGNVDNDFTYSVERYEVSACTMENGKLETIDIHKKPSTSVTYGEIISAISVNDINHWTAFTDFNSTESGDIKIDKSDIFRPSFSSKNLSITSTTCNGISAHSDPSSMTVYVMPKFRNCPKEYKNYSIKKSGLNGKFTWSNTNTCNGTKITKDGVAQLTIGTFSGDLTNPTVSKTGSGATVSVNGNSVILKVTKNNDPVVRRFNVTVKFTICGVNETTTCTFCQEEGVNVIKIPCNCSTGLVSLISPTRCGESGDQIHARLTQ
jgi:hypothetical protein